MSAAQKSRQRRNTSHRDRTPRHVEAILDPTWQSPYTPSAYEREVNRRALRTTALRRSRRWLLAAAAVFAVTVVVALAGIWIHAVGGWWWPIAGLVLVMGVVGINEWRLRRLEAAIPTLAHVLSESFQLGGSTRDDQRLSTIVDRLSATFGLHDVTVRIVLDGGYNAALLPGDDSLTLLVTSALMNDFELIEIEGVVAHLMARERLGSLERSSAASVAKLTYADAHALAGAAGAYRADEVAAAGIRYPLGLSQALARCAAQSLPKESFFSSEQYAATRWVWFDLFADGTSTDSGELNDATVRSRALAEW